MIPQTSQTAQTSEGSSLLRISPNDNVLVLTSTLSSGSEIHVGGVTRVFDHDLALGHKIAACDIKKGEFFIKGKFPYDKGQKIRINLSLLRR